MPPTSFNGIPIGNASSLLASLSGTAAAGTTASHSSAGRPGHQRRQSADSVIPSRAHISSGAVAGAGAGGQAHARQPPLATTTTTTTNITAPSQAGQAKETYVPSLMDTLPPFNPALNALRAPQTPAKGGLAGRYKVQALPLLPGEFPRLNAASGSGMAGGLVGGAAPVGGGYGHVSGQVQVQMQMGQQHQYQHQTPGKGQGQGQYAGADFHNSPAASSLPKPDLDDF